VWEGDSVLTVPASALFRSGQWWSVFVVERGRAQQRDIRLGHRTSAAAEVLEGLRAGELVVLSPSDRIGTGVRITTP